MHRLDGTQVNLYVRVYMKETVLCYISGTSQLTLCQQLLPSTTVKFVIMFMNYVSLSPQQYVKLFPCAEEKQGLKLNIENRKTNCTLVLRNRLKIADNAFGLV